MGTNEGRTDDEMNVAAFIRGMGYEVTTEGEILVAGLSSRRALQTVLRGNGMDVDVVWYNKRSGYLKVVV